MQLSLTQTPDLGSKSKGLKLRFKTSGMNTIR